VAAVVVPAVQMFNLITAQTLPVTHMVEVVQDHEPVALVDLLMWIRLLLVTYLAVVAVVVVSSVVQVVQLLLEDLAQMRVKVMRKVVITERAPSLPHQVLAAVAVQEQIKMAEPVLLEALVFIMKVRQLLDQLLTRCRQLLEHH
jgi:hypothetical protein